MVKREISENREPTRAAGLLQRIRRKKERIQT